MREKPSLSPWTSFALTVKVFFWSTVGAFLGTALFYVVAYIVVTAYFQEVVDDWASRDSGQRQSSPVNSEERARTVALGESTTVGGVRFTGWRIVQAKVKGTRKGFGAATCGKRVFHSSVVPSTTGNSSKICAVGIFLATANRRSTSE